MKLTRNLPYWLLVAASCLWLAVVFWAAWGRSEGQALSGLVYAFFHPVCHQIAGRSFACFGEPLPVCARCLGLYSGFAAGLLLWPVLGWLREKILATPRLVVAFAVPMLVDVFLVDNTAWSRFGTGLLAAFPVALLAWAAAVQLTQRPSDTSMGESYEPGPAR